MTNPTGRPRRAPDKKFRFTGKTTFDEATNRALEQEAKLTGTRRSVIIRNLILKDLRSRGYEIPPLEEES